MSYCWKKRQGIKSTLYMYGHVAALLIWVERVIKIHNSKTVTEKQASWMSPSHSPWYISSLSKQFPCRGQVSFCRQLHLGWSWVFSSDRILLLCDFITLPKLGKQLKLTLTLFLLNILWNLLVFRKCFSKSFRKVFPMFVSTFTLYGGLNHIIFLCLTFFEGVKSCW